MQVIRPSHVEESLVEITLPHETVPRFLKKATYFYAARCGNCGWRDYIPRPESQLPDDTKLVGDCPACKAPWE